MHTWLLGKPNFDKDNSTKKVVTKIETQISDGLATLIQANEPFWGAEAEIIRTYWDAPMRTQATDKKWLVHQIYKEYWDGILPPLEAVKAALPLASTKHGRAKLLQMSEVLYEEVEHFSLFADLYLTLEGSDYALSPEKLAAQGSWTENDDLMKLRQQHRDESPELGRRAYHFTEGGHCALFTEGMKINGRNRFDDAVAEVCRRIYEDEISHMLLGIAGADEAALSPADWATLTRTTIEQMKKRILMRNAQFSRPVSEERLAELLAGKATPVKFDFEHAARLMNKHA
jgi:hypothetical protein